MAVTKPLDDIEVGDHCFDHVAVTERGREVLRLALADQALNNSDPQIRADSNELLEKMLLVEPVT